jgi:hypothetical protein
MQQGNKASKPRPFLGNLEAVTRWNDRDLKKTKQEPPVPWNPFEEYPCGSNLFYADNCLRFDGRLTNSPQRDAVRRR